MSIVAVNPREFAQKYIAMKLGFNVQIQDIKQDKKIWNLVFKVNVPYKLELKNGTRLSGNMLVKNIGTAILKEEKDGFSLVELVDIKKMDQIIDEKIAEFNGNVRVIRVIWNGVEN